MNEIQTFDFDGSGIRTLTIGDEPYFVGKDVAQVLGYRDTADALKKHVDEEDKLTRQFADSGQRREMKVINESGLYSLILGSKLPEAKRFKRWVTSEVLPAIRKTGMYAVDQLLEDPDLAIRAFTQLKEEREARRQLELQNAQMKPKALFAEAVETSSTSILIGDMAKLLRQNGVEVGQRRLFDWLRTNGWLMKTGESRNMPTQKAMEKGYFEIKERAIQNPDGSVRITKTTKVTGKGQVWLTNEFMGDRGKAVAYYAFYKTRSGDYAFEVAYKPEMEQFARTYSQAYSKGYSSPWKTNFDEMAKKTLLKRVLKYAPMSTEIAMQVQSDSTIKHYDPTADQDTMKDLTLAHDETEYIEAEYEETPEQDDLDARTDPVTGEVKDA